MAAIHFFHNVANNQQNSIRSLILGVYGIGFTRPAIASKPTNKTVLVLLVLCWLCLTNMLKPLNSRGVAYLLVVGSFLAHCFFGGNDEE